MNRIENFTNLREMQKKAGSGEPVGARFAKKRIIFEPIEGSKLATQSAELLQACITSGLFKPDTFVGKNSVTHISKQEIGPAFVELTIGSTTYNVFADLLAPDPRKFIRNADLKNLTDSDKITVISGMCLFSAPATPAKLENGTSVDLCEPGALEGVTQKILDIDVDPRLQASEMDTILRLTKLISAINPGDKKTELALNIPRVEYYMYILGAFEKGLIEPDTATKWFNLVDERYNRMENLMRKRVPSEFVSANVNPLDGIEGKIRGLVSSDERNVFGKLVNALKAQSLVWKYAIDKVPPKKFGDISNLSYVVAYLMVTQDCTFPIAIENPEEMPITRNLKNILDGLSIRLLMLYPHSNAIPDFEPKNGKINNYFFPSQENQLGVLREISRLNRQI